ncbi:MAG: MOSC domain-containing protein [Maricaulaceae bacterium]
MQISQLKIYPVKSCQGLSINTAEVRPRGLAGDRRAMVVDSSGTFLSLRSHPKMALIHTRLSGGELTLDMGGKTIPVTLTPRRETVTVWRDQVDARLADDTVNAALSDFLGEELRLAVMDDQSQRPIEADWASGQVSLADAYPILITNTASLAALSGTAGRDLSMDQFRPNIVLDTDQPWGEDGWRSLCIGEIIFDFIKPCTRCVVTTLDTKTGQVAHPETMEAMVKTRRSGDPRVKGVLFGWNAVPRSGGMLNVGDKAEVLEAGEAWPILAG